MDESDAIMNGENPGLDPKASKSSTDTGGGARAVYKGAVMTTNRKARRDARGGDDSNDYTGGSHLPEILP